MRIKGGGEEHTPSILASACLTPGDRALGPLQGKSWSGCGGRSCCQANPANLVVPMRLRAQPTLLKPRLTPPPPASLFRGVPSLLSALLPQAFLTCLPKPPSPRVFSTLPVLSCSNALTLLVPAFSPPDQNRAWGVGVLFPISVPSLATL